MLGIFRRRVYEAAATAAPATVTLDGKRVPVSGLADLAHLYAGRKLAPKELAVCSPSAVSTLGHQPGTSHGLSSLAASLSD